MTVSDELKQTVGKALGRIPSGVFILSARHNGETSAMMASWVQQAAFDPPAISVAIAKDRPIRRLIVDSGRFALGVVAEHDKDLMRRFARGVAPGADPFAGAEVFVTPAGGAVPAESLAWMDCEVMQMVHVEADHDLLIARVTAGALMREGASFMHIRGNGFHY